MLGEEALLAQLFFDASPGATEIMVRNNLFTISSVKEYLSSGSSDGLLTKSQISAHQELLDLFNKYSSEMELSRPTNDADHVSYSDSISCLTTNRKGVNQPYLPDVKRCDSTHNDISPSLKDSKLEYVRWPMIIASLGTRSRNVLSAMGILDYVSLAKLNLDELREQENVGKKTFKEISDAQSSIHNAIETREHAIAESSIAIPTSSILWARFSTIFSGLTNMPNSFTLGDCINFNENTWAQIEGMGIAFRDDTWETWSNLTVSVLAFRSMPVSLISEISAIASIPFDEDKYHDVSNIPIINIERNLLRWVVIPRLYRNQLHVLGTGGYVSITDMNGISEKQLLQKHGLNLYSIILIAIFYNVTEIIVDQVESAKKYRSLDSSSRCKDLYELTSNILNDKIKDARAADIYYKRHFHNKYKENTLEVLAEAYGVTRERIRQIELKAKAVYSQPDFSTYISSLLDAAQDQISKEPVQSVNDFAKAICSVIGYTIKDDHHGYSVLAKLIDGVCYDHSLNFVFMDSYPCAKCEKLLERIRTLFDDPTYAMPFIEIYENTLRFCRNEECKASLSINALRYAVAKIPKLDIVGEEIRTLASLLSERMVVDHVIEKICLQSGSSIHFKTIAEIIKREYPQIKIDSDRVVHIWATKNKKLLLWDRGCFIHRSHVHIDQQKLTKVHKWIEGKLSKYKVQFISGVYRHFKKELKLIGISTEMALYTSLRICKYSDLVLPKYPQIYLKNKFEGRLSSSAILEDFLEEYGGPASLDDLKQYAIGCLGMKEFSLNQSLAGSNYILRSSYSEYIHSSYVNGASESFAGIIEYVIQQAEKYGYISIDSVFLDKQITCKKLGINNSILLYSIINSLTVHSINMSGYPTITFATKKEESSFSVVDRIVEYIYRKNGSCLLQEIEGHFCGKLGYKQQYIGLARKSDKILRYSSSSIVHVENIKCSFELEDIVQFSIDKFDSIAQGRQSWVNIDDLICMGLPDLANGMSWTATLLASILERSEKVSIIGTNRKIYTIRDENGKWRNSLGLIIYEILEDKYGGATSIQQIEKELNILGVIANRLTTTMIRACTEIAINGDTIMVSRIAEDVARY